MRTKNFSPRHSEPKLNKARLEMLGRDRRSESAAPSVMFPGAYNSEFLSVKRVGQPHLIDRQSPQWQDSAVDGGKPRRLPPPRQEFRLAMLQSTDTCKNREAACSGG